MDRRSLTFSVVLVASITLSSILITAQQNAAPSSAVKQQANSNQSKEPENAANQNAKQVPPIDAFFGLSANAWIALFTIILSGVAGLQALIYFLQLRTAHRAERAYVYIDGVSGLDNFGADKVPTIAFDVVNSGRTPARILAHNAFFWVEKEGKKLPPKLRVKKDRLKTIDFWMITNRRLPLTVGFKDKITAEEFKDITAGKRQFFVFGTVIYRDRFQWFRTHYTNFCFVLDLRKPRPEDGANATVVGFSIAPNSYNDAN